MRMRIFNADVPAAQLYLYEKDLFPFAFLHAHVSNQGVSWKLHDDAEACEYEVPPLKGARLEIVTRVAGAIPSFKDPLESITVKASGNVYVIEKGDEASKLLELVKLVQAIDPDIILTENGDAFIFPYLIHRALLNDLSSQLVLDREGRYLHAPSKNGKTYLSYGRIYYKPTPSHLLGRLHLDARNDFIFEDCGLHGLIETARTCRTPLHRASRETIGTNMTSLQMYQAFRRDILIPWKKNDPENFKSAWELLKADRGGFVLEPKIGLFDAIGEIDFASLYPTLMMKHNLTPECISCACCEEDAETVPDVANPLCAKKVGIIPHTLRILLQKRAQYKALMNHATDKKLRSIYDQRQAALKWILVCCLPHETLVPVLTGGQLRIVKIGSLVDSMVGENEGIFECNQDIYVVGLDTRFRTKYSRVKRLVKTQAPVNLLDITMANGRRICATPNHEFYILRDGRLRTETADKLKSGDLMPVGKSTPDPPVTVKEIDLVQSLLNQIVPPEIDSWKIKGNVLKQAVKRNRKVFYKMGVPHTNVHSWIRTGIVPLRYLKFLSMLREQHRRLLVGRGRKKGGRTTWVPSTIRVDRDLGFFLGLFIADGTAGKSFLRFDIGQDEPELLEYLKDGTRKLFRLKPHITKEKKAKMYVAQTNSITLVRVLETVFGVGRSADRGKLCIPSCILNARPGAILGFISGLIAGEGSVHNTRNIVSIASASKEFLTALSYLLLRVRFQHSLHRSRRKKFDLYRLDIVDPVGLIKLKKAGLLKRSHKRRLSRMTKRDCTQGCRHIAYELLPVVHSSMRSLARKLRTVRGPRVDAQVNRLCPDRAIQMLHKLRAGHADQRYPEEYNFLEKLITGDIGFVSVREIKATKPSSDFVYCFELDDSIPGFFAGNGAVFTHNSFGYLGYRNARFGKIDAHIAVCAFARQVLRRTVRIAQQCGFTVVHGIIDSVWLRKAGAGEEDYVKLCRSLEERLGLPVSFEGIYRWIMFLPSKVHTSLPVLNRYYGAFQNGKVKVRGIEYRRRDTPEVVKKCQRDFITCLAPARDSTEFRERLPEALRIVRGYVRRLQDGQVDIEDLMITKQLSKELPDYTHNVTQVVAARQLAKAGAKIFAGQTISYLLQSERGSDSMVLPAELVNGGVKYDVNRYIQLLLGSITGLLGPVANETQPLLSEIMD